MSAGFPGWDGRVPSSDGTIAEILRDHGYNTFAVGKYGVTPDEDATDAGPFDRWPWALNSPFQGTKQDASHLGGTTDPLVVAWPGHIKDAGGLRTQFSHVNDIAPTIYDIVGA